MVTHRNGADAHRGAAVLVAFQSVPPMSTWNCLPKFSATAAASHGVAIVQ